MAEAARQLDNTRDSGEQLTPLVASAPAHATPEEIKAIEKKLAPLTVADALDPDDVQMVASNPDDTAPKIVAKRSSSTPPPLPKTNSRTSTPPPVPPEARRLQTIPAPAPVSIGTNTTEVTTTPKDRAPTTPPPVPTNMMEKALKSTQEQLAVKENKLKEIKAIQEAISQKLVGEKVPLTEASKALEGLTQVGVQARSLSELLEIKNRIEVSIRQESDQMLKEGRAVLDSEKWKALNKQKQSIQAVEDASARIGNANMDLAMNYNWNNLSAKVLQQEVGKLRTDIARQEPALALRRVNEAEQYAQKLCDSFAKTGNFSLEGKAKLEQTQKDILFAIDSQKDFIPAEVYQEKRSKIEKLFNDTIALKATAQATVSSRPSTPPPIPEAALRAAKVNAPSSIQTATPTASSASAVEATTQTQADSEKTQAENFQKAVDLLKPRVEQFLHNFDGKEITDHNLEFFQKPVVEVALDQLNVIDAQKARIISALKTAVAAHNQQVQQSKIDLPPVPVSTHRDAIVPEPRITSTPAVATSPEQSQAPEPLNLDDVDEDTPDPFSVIDSSFTVDAPKKSRWGKALDWAKKAVSRDLPDEAQLARTVSNRLDKYPNLTDEARAQIQARILEILAEDSKKSPAKLRKLVDNAVTLHEETMKKFRESLTQKPKSETDKQMDSVVSFFYSQLDAAQRQNATINEASIVPQVMAKIRKIKGLSGATIAQYEQDITDRVRDFNQTMREARAQPQNEPNTVSPQASEIPLATDTNEAENIFTTGNQTPDRSQVDLAQSDALTDQTATSAGNSEKLNTQNQTEQPTVVAKSKTDSTETTNNKPSTTPNQLEFNFNLTQEQSEAKIQEMAENILKQADKKEFKAGKLYAFDDLADMYERNGKADIAQEIRKIKDNIIIHIFNFDGTLGKITTKMINNAMYDIMELELPKNIRKQLFSSLTDHQEKLNNQVDQRTLPPTIDSSVPAANDSNQLNLGLAA